jgi:hypothetical protein
MTLTTQFLRNKCGVNRSASDNIAAMENKSDLQRTMVGWIIHL